MYKFVFAILALLVFQSTFSQTKSKERLEEMFQQEFSKVVTGTPFVLPGNYAGLSTSDKTISASLFFASKDNQMFSVGIAGGASNGITEVFTEGELNSKVSVSAGYHFVISTKDEYISRDFKRDTMLGDDMAALEVAYEREKLIIENGKEKRDAQKKIESLKKAIKKNDSIRLVLKQVLLANTDQSKTQILQDSIQELELRIKLATYDQTVANAVISKYANNGFAALVNNKEYKKNDAVKKIQEARDALTANGVNIAWASLGVGATNDKFVLFDETLSNADQLQSDDYSSFSISGSINFLKTADLMFNDADTLIKIQRHGTSYLSIGGVFKYTNNISGLTQVEVVDTKVISEEPLREVKVRQAAFSGIYEEDIAELTTTIDYYKYINEENALAIHLLPSYTFRENKKPVGQMLFGILIPFKNKAKQKTVINLEFFYRLNDIFNTSENKNSLLNRNSIGIQTIFPFALK